MKKILKDENGFTLIEMMSVLTISAIIAVGSGIILFSSHRFLNHANQKANLQRELNLAFEIIGKKLRVSETTTLRIYTYYGGASNNTGTCLYLTESTGDEYYFYKENNHLMYKINSNSAEKLIDNLLTDIQFTRINMSVVQLYLNLSVNQYSLSNTSRFTVRN